MKKIDKATVINFNPHFPHGKWQGYQRATPKINGNFNPHFPHGKWPAGLGGDCMGLDISIHTSLTGSDPFCMPKKEKKTYFNPHFPHGKWLELRFFHCRNLQFQSTLPSREVTYITNNKPTFTWFQSTLPSREVTQFRNGFRESAEFQSTLPSREVTLLTKM